MPCFLVPILFLGHLKNKKQSLSIEAEYKALVDATSEVSWLQILLFKLEVVLP